MDQELFDRVENALKTIRPYLEADGGDVELLEIEGGNTARLELKGACSTCSMSHMTMKAGIEETIMRAVPEIKFVHAVRN
ncbi:MAG: NifU family protein [Burkholderiales bacterium]|nr:NifU family protein [Bacteroidia bacterium]